MDLSKLREHFKRATTVPEEWSGDHFFTNDRGEFLRYAHAPAQTGRTRGTIIHRHGAGESLDLYYETICWYQHQGFDVWAYDLSGYGLSDGKNPNHNPSPKDTIRHVNDLDCFIKNVVKPTPDKPLIMSNHSLSGHSGLIYLHKHPEVFQGAIMSSPMFDIYRMGLPAIFRPLIRGIFSLACTMGLKDVETPAAGYSRILDRVKKTSESLTTIALGQVNYRGAVKQMIKELHPDRYRDRPTFGWVRAAYITLMPTLRRSFLQSIHTPTLIGSAGVLEELVDTGAHARAARLMPRAELAKMHFADHNLWHDNDKNNTEWTDYVRDFLDRVAPRTAAPPIFLDRKSSILVNQLGIKRPSLS
ncbi:MAG: lysophospholipase [Alphaproteobacteria bacterium]|nr:lysophospholipase [Alphaproteobacteria bacterium]